jgi:uncharacterized membrane protein
MLIVTYLAPVIVSLLGGQRLMQWLQFNEIRQITTLGIGLLIFVILTTIPLLGWVVSLTASLLALGAMWVSLRGQRYRSTSDRPLLST